MGLPYKQKEAQMKNEGIKCGFDGCDTILSLPKELRKTKYCVKHAHVSRIRKEKVCTFQGCKAVIVRKAGTMYCVRHQLTVIGKLDDKKISTDSIIDLKGSDYVDELQRRHEEKMINIGPLEMPRGLNGGVND